MKLRINAVLRELLSVAKRMMSRGAVLFLVTVQSSSLDAKTCGKNLPLALNNLNCPVFQKREEERLRIILLQPQKMHKTSDRIELLVLIENIGLSQSFYIGQGYFGIYYRYHLELYDKYNKKIKLTEYAGDPPVGYQNNSLQEVLNQDFTLIRPEKIYGFRWEIDTKLKPGIYRAIIKYRSGFASSYKENELNSLEFPIWQQAMQSNTLRIRVVR